MKPMARTVQNPAGGYLQDGEFTAHSGFGALSYAYAMNRNSHLGVTTKFLIESIDENSAYTFAWDFGYEVLAGDFSAGLSLSHLGLAMKYGDENFALPVSLQAGGALSLLGNKLRNYASVEIQSDNIPVVRLGVAYRMHSALRVRAGYRFGQNESAWDGISAGLGLVWNNAALDYSLAPAALLGVSHRISLSLRFGAKTDNFFDASKAADFGRAELKPIVSAPEPKDDAQATEAYELGVRYEQDLNDIPSAIAKWKQAQALSTSVQTETYKKAARKLQKYQTSGKSQ